MALSARAETMTGGRTGGAAIVCLLLALTCLLAVVTPAHALGDFDCLRGVDGSPLSSSSIGLSDTSLFYATNFAQVGALVHLRMVGGGYAAGDSASNSTVLPNPRTSNCFVPNGQTEVASVLWGKSIAMSADILAVGAPTKIMSGQANYYSVIDLFHVSRLTAINTVPTVPSRNLAYQQSAAASTDGIAATPVWLKATDSSSGVGAASIADNDAFWLGLSVSLNEDATFVASLFDLTQVAVFSTAQPRATAKYNAATDALLTLPTDFIPDSLALRGRTATVATATLAVSGSMLGEGGLCTPAVVIYEYAAAAWSTGTVHLILRSPEPESRANFITCPTGPSNAYSVALSDEGGEFLVVGVKEWKAVAVAEIAHFSEARILIGQPSDAFTRFGSRVAFSYTPTQTTPTITVFTQQAMLTFVVSDFLASNREMYVLEVPGAPEKTFPTVTQQIAAVFPNRLQRPAALGKERTVLAPIDLLDFAAASGFSVALTSAAQGLPSGSIGSPSSYLLSNPSAPAGKQYHVDLQRFVECPKGFFQDGAGSNPASAKWHPTAAWSTSNAGLPTSSNSNDTFLLSGSLQQPCSFCPLGTYQDVEGSTTCKPCPESTFCPPGSVLAYSDFELGKPNYENGLGEFETESISEAFEELVINKIFKPQNPGMATVIAFVSLFLFLLALYWLPFLPMSVRNFASSTLNLLAFVNIPEEDEEKSGDHHEEEHSTAGGHGATAHGPSNGHGTHGVLVAPKRPGSGNKIHDEAQIAETSAQHAERAPIDAHNVAVSTSASPPSPVDPLEHAPHKNGQYHNFSDRLKAKKLQTLRHHMVVSGCFNLIFVILLIATLVFAITFLTYYEPQENCGGGKNNCISTDVLALTDGAKEDYAQGFLALGSVQANLYLDIIGLTGLNADGSTALCSEKTFLDLRVRGCTIAGSATPCNATNAYIDSTEFKEYKEGELSTEEFLHPQAGETCRLRWEIVIGTLFSTQMITEFVLPASISWTSLRFFYLQAPEVYNPDAPAGTSVIFNDDYEIGHTNFVENYMRTPDPLQGGSVPLESYPQSLVTREWTYGVQGREIQVSDDIPVHNHITFWNSVNSVAVNATYQSYRQWLLDPSPVTVVRIVQTTNAITWRKQSVSKLVQPSLAFLTILLGLIAVLHLVKFGLELLEVSLVSWDHFTHASRLAAKHAQLMSAEMAASAGRLADGVTGGGKKKREAKDKADLEKKASMHNLTVHPSASASAAASEHPIASPSAVEMHGHAHVTVHAVEDEEKH